MFVVSPGGRTSVTNADTYNLAVADGAPAWLYALGVVWVGIALAGVMVTTARRRAREVAPSNEDEVPEEPGAGEGPDP